MSELIFTSFYILTDKSQFARSILFGTPHKIRKHMIAEMKNGSTVVDKKK